MNTPARNLTLWLAVALGIAVLDQLTKHLASSHLDYAVPRPLLPGLNLTLLHNTGAAFSLFHDQSGWQRWFFAAVAVVIGTAIVYWLATLEAGQRWAPLALALILGGAVGNLVDRLYLGYVVDFIDVYYGRWSWPAFNLADSAICVGAAMLIIRGPRAPQVRDPE